MFDKYSLVPIFLIVHLNLEKLFSPKYVQMFYSLLNVFICNLFNFCKTLCAIFAHKKKIMFKCFLAGSKIKICLFLQIWKLMLILS